MSETPKPTTDLEDLEEQKEFEESQDLQSEDLLSGDRDLHDETGAQAMEYAMLGGAGVASVSFVTWLMRQPWFADAMESLISGFLSELGSKITSLLPGSGGIF